MTSEKVNRHRARQEKLSVLRESREETEKYRVPVVLADNGVCLVEEHDVLAKFSDQQRHEIQTLSAPVEVSPEEVNQLIKEIRSRWDGQQMNALLSSCRSSVLSSIVGPFGLGGIVAVMDKEGGNVTTVHNAKQNIYANKEDQYNRSHYAGAAYNAARDKYKDQKIIENSGMVMDEYSGNLIDYSAADCDHIKAAETYHQEGGFMQSTEVRKEFGSDPGNFALTTESANRSLKSQDKKEWQEKTATKGSGENNKEYHEHDNRRVNAAVARGEQTAQKYAPGMKEKAVYYGKQAAKTGVSEGFKMGLQQSLGLLLKEFFSASFDEIADAYKRGFRDSLRNQSFFDALKERLSRIAARVADKWKETLVAFSEGAVSGFLSNLVTMLINMLVTTGKRIVRVIREGFMSIMRALKMALFPPEGMSAVEASDAALKLLATGVTVSLGILAEEAVEKSVALFLNTNMPPLAPLASTVSAVFVGAMTGIASALLVYGLDRLDVFGVNAEKQHAFILSELDSLIIESDQSITSTYEEEMGRAKGLIAQLQGS
ncbi:MAG: hypothetical protein JSR69_22020 [Proteobacteria bacterium]|nr:hypothetical protein [Pseudomonadota bacterium]